MCGVPFFAQRAALLMLVGERRSNCARGHIFDQAVTGLNFGSVIASVMGW
jgi:hypothetical protein